MEILKVLNTLINLWILYERFTIHDADPMAYDHGSTN